VMKNMWNWWGWWSCNHEHEEIRKGREETRQTTTVDHNLAKYK
jgi:hypothetical protein